MINKHCLLSTEPQEAICGNEVVEAGEGKALLIIDAKLIKFDASDI